MAEQQKLSCLKFLYADITSNTYFTWFTWNVLGETDVSDNGQIIMSGFFSISFVGGFPAGLVKGLAGGSPAEVLTLFSPSYCR